MYVEFQEIESWAKIDIAKLEKSDIIVYQFKMKC